MTFAIIAESVLGTYRGHGRGGEVDVVPSPARLLSALLCAAAQGPYAQDDGAALHPRETDLAALSWLEANPPDGVRMPRHVVNGQGATAYRSRLRETRGAGAAKSQVIAKDAQRLTSVAVDGPYAWTWRDGPPKAVRQALETLCAEVPHLGMAETPVRLRAGTAEPTHDLRTDANWWERAAEDLDLETTGEGRLEALLAAYREGQKPSPDKPTQNERHEFPARVTDGLVQRRYATRTPAPPQTPWGEVWLAKLDAQLVDEADRVRWAVTAHKALIKMIGYGAPPVLTGAYAPGVERPANRCAIQVLSERDLKQCAVNGEFEAPAALALMLPTGLDAADDEILRGAWRLLTTLRSGRTVLNLGDRREIRADRFWAPPPQGFRRSWRTSPAAVPETRGQGRHWTLQDAVHLSVGMVLRDQLGVGAGKGAAWYREIVAAVREAGVAVDDAAPIRDGDLSRFVHKIPKDLPLRPYAARLRLGDRVPDGTIMAIGQARHLGNGLLVPADAPAKGAR